MMRIFADNIFIFTIILIMSGVLVNCIICKHAIDSTKPTVKLREKGSIGINEASKLRGDDLHTNPGQEVHTDCRRIYCNPNGIKKTPKKTLPNPLSLRSSNAPYHCNTHCLFCGQLTKCVGRKRGYDVFPVRTLEFQENIEKVCLERNDHWAEQVKTRLKCVHDLPAADAIYHQSCSVNFRTGRDIPQIFQPDVKKSKKHGGRPVNADQMSAFLEVSQYLRDNDDEQITIVELVERMKGICGELAYTVTHMRTKLQEHFDSSIIITDINGKKNVVTFRNNASSILHSFYERPKTLDPLSEKREIIKTAAKLLLNDIKSIDATKVNYPNPSDLMSIESNLDYIPDCLKLLLRTLFIEANADMKIASIGQAVIQASRPRVLITPLQIGLGVQMHHHFSSKFLVDTLYRLGFCSSYTEIKKFEVSAAASQGTDIPGNNPGQFTQYIADNVDHNIRTLDGHNTFHGMGIIACVTQGTKETKAVPRVSATTDDLIAIGKIKVHFYRQENNNMSSKTFECLPTFEIEDPTNNIDLLAKIAWPLRGTSLKSHKPGWSGMMQMIQKGPYPGQSSIYFLPMIDMNPTDLSCIYSTLMYVSEQAKQQGTEPVLTFDQPLYWKALTIICNEPSKSNLKEVVLRLGGFHIEMSFLGCIGKLMECTGISELLEIVYASNTVAHMLSGKAAARAIRGHFLVDDVLNAMLVEKAFDINLFSKQEHEELNDKENNVDINNNENENSDNEIDSESEIKQGSETITNQISDEILIEVANVYDKLMESGDTVESISCEPVFEKVKVKINNVKQSLSKFPTAKLWLMYMTMVDLLRNFIKAERTGCWQLHLQTLCEMLPYFAAAGHNLYAKSAHIYLQTMGRLKDEHPIIYDFFNDGYHVVRRSDRFWAGLSSDLVIEQVLMRSVKATGGMTRGRGLTESQRAQWLLSMPACADINRAMQSVTNINYQTSDQHVESRPARKKRDLKDKMKFYYFLQERNPFAEDATLRNIETGMSADTRVNVNSAEKVGNKVLESMIGKNVLEYSFKKCNQAVTLGSKSSLKVDGEAITVDPQLLFQRLIAAADRLFDNQADIFSYELCSFPSSLFEASGLLREADKPSLANTIWSLGECDKNDVSEEHVQYVLDGGSLLQHLPWNKGETFGSICETYVDYVTRRYQTPTIVFDGYSTGSSTKDCTHIRRTRGVTCPKVQFDDTTPFRSKKEHFLTNVENKQAFIDLLGHHLDKKGCRTIHATSDADVLIVKTAVECARVIGDTVVVGKDTDLLILLCYHCNLGSNNLFFISGTNRVNAKIVKKWNIKKTVQAIGPELCKQLPFVHALTGSDTTSRLFGIGKGPALKKLRSNNYLKEQADVFMNENATKESIIKAGEEAIICLYNGKPHEGLDALRFRKFANKVMTSTTCVQVHTLPPTSAAASYHSLRVYLQIQEWISGKCNALDPLEWGWKTADDMLLPIKTHLPPAPDDLLKIIRCNCKVNCDTKRCTCRKHGLECSFGCGECHGVCCSNTQTVVETESDNLEDL